MTSSAAAAGQPAPIEWHLGYRSPEGAHERGSVGGGVGIIAGLVVSRFFTPKPGDVR